MKSLIIGYGNIGKHLFEEYKNLELSVVDKYKKINIDYKENAFYDFAFICVDTPKNEKSLCDITEVENALNEYKAKTYVIKSTVLPNTCDTLSKKYNKEIVFSPEFYGITQHALTETDFTILGGNIKNTAKVQQLLQKVYTGSHIFRHTDFKTAELSKYMINSFLALKVSFCGEFYKMCKALNIHYEELRELFILDKRISPSHTFIYEEHPYWKSHCFDKDVPAIAETFGSDLLKKVVEINNTLKEE